MPKISLEKDTSAGNNSLVIKADGLRSLSTDFVLKHSPYLIYQNDPAYRNIVVKQLAVNDGSFTGQPGALATPNVTIFQTTSQILITCECFEQENRFCEHQSQILLAILRNNNLLIFFDNQLRSEKLRKFAAEYGLQEEPDLDTFFKIVYKDAKITISPNNPALLAGNKDGLDSLKDLLLTHQVPKQPPFNSNESITGVVLKQHKYYKNLLIDLFDAPSSKDGKVKNPLKFISPGDFIWQSEDKEELKFYAAVSSFQNVMDAKRSEDSLSALRAILRNPAGYAFYYHDPEISEKLTATSIKPISVSIFPNSIILTVNRKFDFYEIGLSIKVDGFDYELKDLELKFNYFIPAKEELLLVDNLQILALIDLLKKKENNLLIHASQYKEFKRSLLEKLEENISVDYQYIKPATASQLKQYEAEAKVEKIIYLSDFGSQVMIIPVMRYGEAEIPVRSRKQIYELDNKGNEFLIYRDHNAETAFISLLIRQHPFLEEQLTNGLQYFYLHKKRFLDEDWFLNAFEEWERQDISILGFSELEGNKLNPNKVKITIHVISGINWFNAIIDVRFGKRKASLKNIHKAIRNKSKFVKLDDGSEGIMPAEWLEKFSKYFQSGEITDEETIRIPKSNFSEIERYYEESMLDELVKTEITSYRQKLGNDALIPETELPAGLNATLRPYQKKGLDWLVFLDSLNFGGCLADDMGLGKTVQIIAFILSQRTKALHNTNLLIVPTSLIANWTNEVARFAPSIRIKTVYGSERIKKSDDWKNYEIVLTTYGTLLSDIGLLKNYDFNYIFLDESQNIKNPESQRYKAVRTLKSRNKITITGTPIENNSFDLYGQLSFACPGLLGSKRYFRDIYLNPIDQFNDRRRAAELQSLVRPFILRRTKQQVASELPDKTEMILYCPMQPEQQKIYDAYEKEFRDYISASTNEELKKSPMNVLKGLTTLRQVCDSPLLLSDRKLTGEASAKIDMLIGEIENKRSEHKILVFSQFVSMLDLIRKELIDRNISFSYLTGQTTKRQKTIDEFQNNPEVRVFLISLKAGGTGLNLTAADYVYLVDPWWNPAVENQAIDRCHRIGQDKHIVAVRLICPGTVEEKILKLQDSKRGLMNELIREDRPKNLFSKNELISILEGNG